MKVWLITGGRWSERRISLRSSAEVQIALLEYWHEVTIYDIPTDQNNLMQDLVNDMQDFYIVMVHGLDGEDGKIPWILELYNVPFQTAWADVMALTMNKYRTTCIRKDAWLPVAKHIIRNPQRTETADIYEKIVSKLGSSCVIKQTSLWSSTWVHLCHNKDDILQTLHIYKNHKEQLLIEQMLEWEEITISILDTADGATALPAILIIPPTWQEFDYENKYNGKTQEICPAPIDDKILAKANKIALQAYKAVWCTSYGRIDMMLTKKWPVLIEINTIPWFTSQSLFPKAAQAYGMDFVQLLQHLIDINT